MSGLESDAARLVISIAATHGKDVDWASALAIGTRLLEWGLEELDEPAKKHAQAVGDEAGAKVTSEDQAEAELRKP